LKEKEPNEETRMAMNEVKEGKVNTYKPGKEMMASLKKAANVLD